MSKHYEQTRVCRNCNGEGEVLHSHLPWDGGTCLVCEGRGYAVYDDLSFGDLTDAECVLLPEEVLNAYGYSKVGGELIESAPWMTKDIKEFFCQSYS